MIEELGSIGNEGRKIQESTRVARGRKPVTESRALELRQRLVEWKQMPESSRPSLRALARELGTLHQLLMHYLDRLEDWEFENRFLAAKEIAQRKAREVRSRAKAQNRQMTMRECCDAIIVPGSFNRLESIMKDFKRGPLYYDQIKIR